LFRVNLHAQRTEHWTRVAYSNVYYSCIVLFFNSSTVPVNRLLAGPTIGLVILRICTNWRMLGTVLTVAISATVVPVYTVVYR